MIPEEVILFPTQVPLTCAWDPPLFPQKYSECPAPNSLAHLLSIHQLALFPEHLILCSLTLPSMLFHRFHPFRDCCHELPRAVAVLLCVSQQLAMTNISRRLTGAFPVIVIVL